jgi:hypothetical protein
MGGTRRALTESMGDASNDNGRVEVRILEARFHPHGQANEFVVIGRVICRTRWAVLEVAPDFEASVPEMSSADSIISNLAYLTVMTRPRPFEGLLSLDNRYWSFVPAEGVLEVTPS